MNLCVFAIFGKFTTFKNENQKRNADFKRTRVRTTIMVVAPETKNGSTGIEMLGTETGGKKNLFFIAGVPAVKRHPSSSGPYRS